MIAGKQDIAYQLVLGEVSGKNAAIHAYDRINWQIRTGFLTLLFLTWGVILKSYAESAESQLQGMQSLIYRMLIISAGLTVGGWFIDMNYLKHKFRVILALDKLIEAIRTVGDDLKAVPIDLLKVAGDNADMPFNCRGYREARRVGICVFGIPLAAIGIVSLMPISPVG